MAQTPIRDSPRIGQNASRSGASRSRAPDTSRATTTRLKPPIRKRHTETSGPATPETAHGHVPVVFDYDEDVSGLNLPVGAQASIAIYTDRVHALSFLRKIILRIKSWENFVF